MSFRLLVVGSVALDSVKTPFGEVRDALGGSATYFSVAASYFTDVSIIAVVGEDFPEEHIDFLRNRGIDLSGLTVEKGETFRWAGCYGYDLNTRDTIETRLNVFENFQPVIPSHLKNCRYVFLANIDPDLQRNVLDQVEKTEFVACDTMNFWIQGKKRSLLETISRVDSIILNDSECRELAQEPNLIRAARIVSEMGPKIVIIKKGEHGALMFALNKCFSAPAFPCETVFDPTGAGDSFAGGFMGHLAKTGDLSPENLRRAIIYGTVMASFCVEEFSLRGIGSLTGMKIEERFRALREVSHFELP